MTDPWSSDPIVVGLPDLLDHVGCADIAQFSAELHDNTDVDTWVDAVPDGIEVRTAATAIVLPFPFTMGQLWAVVAEVEEDYVRRSSVDDLAAAGCEAAPVGSDTASTRGRSMAGEVADDELAQLLGIDRGALVLALGGGWRSGLLLPDDAGAQQWFVHGEPARVAIGRVGGDFVLARPKPSWSGAADLVWHFEDRRSFTADDVLARPGTLAQAADDLAARRRRTFRWCRTCRELQAPEWLLRDEGCCMGCATQHHGQVF